MPSGTLARTSNGEIEEVEALFVSTRVDAGAYAVSVTRKDQDFYRIDGTSIYVRTRYCYEYSYSQQAILHVSGAGYLLGTLTLTEP